MTSKQPRFPTILFLVNTGKQYRKCLPNTIPVRTSSLQHNGCTFTLFCLHLFINYRKVPRAQVQVCPLHYVTMLHSIT